MTKHEFQASWGLTLRLTSLFGSLVILGVPLGLLLMLERPESAGRLLAVLLPVWFLTVLYTIRAYRIEKGALFIKRLFWTTRVDLSGLEAAEMIDVAQIRGSLRVCGNGGLFSFSGWYWKRELGRYRMWVTDPRKLVLIRVSSGRKMIVSPDRPKLFVEILLKELHQERKADAPVFEPSHRKKT